MLLRSKHYKPKSRMPTYDVDCRTSDLARENSRLKLRIRNVSRRLQAVRGFRYRAIIAASEQTSLTTDRIGAIFGITGQRVRAILNQYRPERAE